VATLIQHTRLATLWPTELTVCANCEQQSPHWLPGGLLSAKRACVWCLKTSNNYSVDVNLN